MKNYTIVLGIIILLGGGHYASADTQYYWVRFIRGEELNGYAKLDRGVNGRVEGTICTYLDTATGFRRTPPQPKGEIGVSGIASSAQIEMEFHPKPSFNPTVLQRLEIAGRRYRLSKLPAAQLNDTAEGMLIKNKGWEYSPLDDKRLRIEFHKIEVVSARKTAEQYIPLEDGKKFDLSRLDNITPEEALTLVSKLKFYGVITPTVVHILYQPKNRMAISDWVRQYGKAIDTVELDNNISFDCDSPLIESIVYVPMLLEFYFSRQIQLSGLVERAYPENNYLTPPFLTMEVRAKEAIKSLNQANLELNERLSGARGYFEKKVADFLKRTRPKYPGNWEVTPIFSGGSFGYRWDVVGPSVSECVPHKWERFSLLIAFIPGNGPSIMISALDGFSAPGPLDQRPSDTRFKDNPLNDEQLGIIQQKLVGFLVSQGVGFGDSDDTGDKKSTCPF